MIVSACNSPSPSYKQKKQSQLNEEPSIPMSNKIVLLCIPSHLMLMLTLESGDIISLVQKESGNWTDQAISYKVACAILKLVTRVNS